MDERPDRCSYCKAPESDTSALVAGPAVAICCDCVGRALNALASVASPVADEADFNAKAPLPYCAFCGKLQVDVKRLTHHGRAQICNECLVTSFEILMERGCSPSIPTRF